MYIKKATKKLTILLMVVLLTLSSNPVYYAPCTQDAGRQCPTDTNQTDFLLSMKKGGTNILSTNTYLYDFFLCEQYNYDCGYLPTQTDFVTISNGVSLDINDTTLTAITTLPQTHDLIYPYIGLKGDSAKCGMSVFPLILTEAQSKQVLDGYMQNLVSTITVPYNQDRNVNTTKTFSTLNINIRTALLQKLKNNATMVRNSTFWNKITTNTWVDCSTQLKSYYKQYGKQIDLHAAYLIDSVTQKCNKQQSINFLIDQSGSIGPPGFQLALSFLTQYVNSTNDDPTKMSINFYDSTYESYIGFGNNLNFLLTKIPIKPYRALGTLTGIAINQSVSLINSANFPNGLPKILAVLTDGQSFDSVVEASNWARRNGIIMIAVGIGSNVNETQLLQIAETRSNYIKLSSYGDLANLVSFISNYFCKQILTIGLNQSINGNYVRVPTSPSYFRVLKSPLSQGQYYQLDITFQSDPRTNNFSVVESQIDPFPDQFTQFTESQHYDIFDPALLQKGLQSDSNNPRLGSTFVPTSIFFIKPAHTVTYRVKKNIQNQMNVTVSYISVTGTNLGFNLTLKVCSTLLCTVQRNYYSSIFKKKNNTSNAIIMVPEEQDLSIFIIIGSTLAALLCLCLVFIFACRKLNDDEEQQKGKQKLNLNETIPTHQNIDENLAPTISGKKISNSANSGSISEQQ